MRAVVLAVAVLAVGCGKVPAERAGAGPVSAEREKEKPKERERDPQDKPGTKPVGRIKLGQVAAEYEEPNANRAAVADKYFGKYWEIDLTSDFYTVEEKHLHLRTHPASRWVDVKVYFRDNKDLLQFGIKDNKKQGAKVIVGRVVSEKKIEDCYVP